MNQTITENEIQIPVASNRSSLPATSYLGNGILKKLKIKITGSLFNKSVVGCEMLYKV